MKLLVLFLALFVERFFGPLDAFRRYDAYHRYVAWLYTQLERLPWLKPASLLLALLPPVLITLFVFELVDGWFLGLFTLMLGAVVLLLTIGDGDLDKALDHYVQAVAAEDEQRQLVIAECILGCAPPEDARERFRAVAEGAAVAANQRLFAVVFWFLVMGPVGAVVYRLSREMQPQTAEYAYPCASSWVAVLDWLPTRLLALTLGLIGRFDAVLPSIQESIQFKLDGMGERNDALLRDTVSVTLEMDEQLPDMDDMPALALFMSAVNNLLMRSVIVWGTVVAVLTLGGYF